MVVRSYVESVPGIAFAESCRKGATDRVAAQRSSPHSSVCIIFAQEEVLEAVVRSHLESPTASIVEAKGHSKRRDIRGGDSAS